MAGIRKDRVYGKSGRGARTLCEGTESCSDLTEQRMPDPVLIFLHIEKAAGTSMTNLLHGNYGEQNVFWYQPGHGSTVFRPEEVEGKKVLCGHRTRAFYQ